MVLLVKTVYMADQQEGTPSAIKQIYGPGLEFWAQQPIKTSTTHIQPTTRQHLGPGDFLASTNILIVLSHYKIHNYISRWDSKHLLNREKKNSKPKTQNPKTYNPKS